MISFLSKIYPLILLAICILAVPLSSRIKKMEEEKQNVFRMMRFPMFVGVATGVIFAIVLLALAFSDVEAGTYIAVALFSLMSLLLISSFFTFHIEYDKEGFTHRNALGIKRRYRYTDVTGISGGAEQGDITLYADGHKIRIDEGANPIKKRDFLKCLQSCPTLCDPIDDSPPGSAVPGILQARRVLLISLFLTSLLSKV